jgi:hypothetical protein
MSWKRINQQESRKIFKRNTGFIPIIFDMGSYHLLIVIDSCPKKGNGIVYRLNPMSIFATK